MAPELLQYWCVFFDRESLVQNKDTHSGYYRKFNIEYIISTNFTFRLRNRQHELSYLIRAHPLGMFTFAFCPKY